MSTQVTPTVRIAGGSHRVEVRAVDGATLAVEGAARVVDADRGVTIDDVSSRLTVTVPTGADLTVGTTSGRIIVTGTVGHLAVTSESGRIEIDAAGSVDARSESSGISIGSVAGACRIRTKSGKVEVRRCGAADVATESSRIELRHVDGAVHAHSVSGRIEVRLDRAHDVDAETVTGRIEVSLPGGTEVFRPAGPTDRRLRPPDAACTVRTRSTTGKVRVAAR